MKILNKDKKIELFDSIETLLIERFQKFNKYLLIDSGIGSDISDINTHIDRMLVYNSDGDREKLALEAENLRQNIYFVLTELNPKYNAFAVMVKSIDGKPCNDLTDEGIKDVLKSVSELTHKQVTDSVDTIKKKLTDELVLYFPQQFADNSMIEYHSYMSRRAEMIIEGIINDNIEEKQSQIERINNMLLTFADPMKFFGSDNAEIAYDKQFETMCLNLTEQLNIIEPKKTTTLTFYNAFEHLKKRLSNGRQSD
ncbi:MAG: hypothetical protein LBP67_04995 [Bacteroidales bacterium]|jgi:hypothetical protein|nr:hypothetical protein [Bacteroidales bacterium]